MRKLRFPFPAPDPTPYFTVRKGIITGATKCVLSQSSVEGDVVKSDATVDRLRLESWLSEKTSPSADGLDGGCPVLRWHRCAREVMRDSRHGREGREGEKQHRGYRPRKVADRA